MRQNNEARMTVVEHIVTIQGEICEYACKYKERYKTEYPYAKGLRECCEDCPVKKLHFK